MTDASDEERFKKIVNPTRYKLFFTKQIDRRISDLGLSEGHLYFILSLDGKQGISLRELTERVHVHKSLTTRMVRSLIENGFAMDAHESGKEYSVVLTKKGEYAKERSIQALKEVGELIMGGLSKDDLDNFLNIIEKIHRRMDDIERQDIE